MPRSALLVTALFAGLAAASAQSPRPPNVLLIVTDDQRPDTVRALGNSHLHTPNLDRLVGAGASFTRAIVAIPHCTPSHGEILTGTSGFTNLVSPFGRAIDPKLARFADTLRAAGYHAWYSGKWMNDGLPRTRGYEETSGLFSAGGAGGRETAKLTHPTAHNGRPVTGYNGWTFNNPSRIRSP